MVLKSYSMARWFVYSIVTVGLFFVCGCGQTQQKQRYASIESAIKFSYLAPTVSSKPPSRIDFQILTFELDARKIGASNGIFTLLDRRSIDFFNYPAFRVNGFAAGIGHISSWDKIAKILRQVSAKKIKTDLLTVYDDAGDDIAVASINSDQNVFYTTSSDTAAGLTLNRGHLAFRIISWPIPEMKGTIILKVVPVFLPQINRSIARLSGNKDSSTIEFVSSQFRAKMGVDDFVMFGPNQDDWEQNTLGSLFFNSTAEVILREPYGDEDDPSSNVLPVANEIEVIRLYFIICTGIRP